MTDTNLDREDPEAIGDSLRQQWNALHHLLGLNQLPAIEGLYDANDAQQQAVDTRVARALTNLVVRTRGGIANQAQLQDLLRDELGRERQTTTPSTADASVARTREQMGVSVAEGYLKVIYRNIEKRDVEQLVRELPASIRPTTNPGTWTVNAVPGFPAPNTTRNIIVDLNHPIWRLGNEQQIRQRLADRTPAQAGVRINPPLLPAGLPLDANMINGIFGSRRDVIDPNLPVGQVVFDNTPIAGQRVIVDLPGMLRAFPNTATMTRADLLLWFTGPPPRFNDFIRAEATVNGGPVLLGAPQWNRAVNTMHIQLGRTPTQPLASAQHSLQEAVLAREPIDRLIQGAADNRELLLALSALQRDPTAISAIQNTRMQDLLTARGRLQRERSLRGALDTLRTLQKPTRTVADINAAILALPVPTNAAAIATVDRQKQVLERELQNALQVQSALQQALAGIAAIPSIVAVLTAAGQPLNGLETARVGGTLEAAIILPATLDPTNIASLIETRYAATAPITNDKGQLLESAAFYDTELTQNSEQVRQAQSAAPENGSEACWAIVRRSLENQGMRPEKADTTVAYMKNQVQHTEESARDVQDLTRSVYAYEGEQERQPGRLWGQRNGDATTEWQEDKTYRSFLSLGLRKYKPDLQAYKNRLFSQNAIGITPAQAENPMSRSVPLGQLINAYFRTKYLMELPDSDPRRLPEDSQEMVTLMRNLHTAILERSQLSFQNATGATQAELAQVGIRPGMKKTERLQAAHSYLLNEKANYFTANKSTMEKIINRAYAPIKSKIDGHKSAKEFWVNRGNNLKGEGSVFNPLTTPAKTGKLIFRILNAEI